MATLIKNSIQKFDVSAKEIAELFCDLNNGEQAEFFNEIYVISKKWVNPFEFQLSEVCSSETLNKNGRKVMRLIGDYSNP